MTELAAVSPLEEDEPLDSLDAELEDSEPDEVPDSEPDPVPLDSELVDPELADVEPPDASLPPALVFEPLEVFAVLAPVLPAAVRALRFADAVSPGSCPDASCT